MMDDRQPRSLCQQFPLRPGYLAQVVVPTNLTKAEADRLCAFIMSLAQPAAAMAKETE